MKRRWLIRLVVLTILATFIVWLEPTRVAWGWLRRESFYKTRPTSYWRGEMEQWQCIPGGFGGSFGGGLGGSGFGQCGIPGGFGGSFGGGFGGFNGFPCWQREPNLFQRHLPKYFPHSLVHDAPPFISADADLTPVLHELKNDPSRRVRQHARHGLRYQQFKHDPANKDCEPPFPCDLYYLD